jgi:CheY-like chemotaxis protein
MGRPPKRREAPRGRRAQAGHFAPGSQMLPLLRSASRTFGIVVTAAISDSNLASAEPRPVLLIVDDDDEIREALEDVLAERGYSVLTAADGRQALARLEQGERPDAIFLDLWMPVMNGWQLLEALSGNPEFNRIPRVVLTAARGQKAKDLNATEVLTKPVRLEQVLGLAERLTAR